jgi:hypothetical protein
LNCGSRTITPPKIQAFIALQDLENAFAEFERASGHPGAASDSASSWGKIVSSKRLDYAKMFNDFAPLLPDSKFPPQSQFAIFCALHIYGSGAFELWRWLREHYCRGRPRGLSAAADEALDIWYAMDAWLQSWLYSPLSCSKPPTDSPSEWLRCIGSRDPTPHLRMNHALLRRLGVPLPSNYSTARRNLLDIKGIFQRNAIVPAGSQVPKIESLINRFPLMGWDIWQRSVYLVTNDVKPPSHYPIFGWRHQRVLDYVRHGNLFHGPEVEREGLGTPWSLHGLLWPQQLDTLRKIGVAAVAKESLPVTSGRMLRRLSAH